MLARRLPLLVQMHRILVIADRHSINPQARTYAEYRVFAAVARHSRLVRRVRVVLRAAAEKPPREDRVACTITVGLEPSGSLRVRRKDPKVRAKRRRRAVVREWNNGRTTGASPSE